MPYSTMKDVPKGLKGAGLNLRQANVWSKIFDRAKVGGAYNPAGVAWTAFKKKYKKVGERWVQRAKQLARNPVEKTIFTHWGNEAIKMKPEILAKKMYELSQEHCPDIPVEIGIDNMTIGPPKKRRPGERVFEEETLSNYLGSKKKFVKQIFKFISPNTKTLFDPMTGSSHVLIEAAKRGIRVIGNDLSPLAFLYSSGIFQGSKLTDEDLEKFKSFPSISGWLSHSKLQRPKNLESKKLIDGLVLGSWKKFSGGKRRTALAAMSLLFQHYFRGFQAFIAEEEPYSRKQILGDLAKCVKDVHELIGEVGGRGRIFSRNVLNEGIPKADVIYFDPPYFPGGGKDGIRYLNHYYIANSTLMQKTFKPEDPTKEDIVKFLPKLARSAKFLIVSCASPSEIQWEKELAKLKKHVKKFRVAKVSTGSQPQGNRANPTVAQSVAENIFCASEREILPARKLERLLFKLEGYDPKKINDAQLGDDLRIVCFPEGTRIWDGWDGKPIEEFKVGNRVKSESGYGTIKKIYEREYAGELIKIKPRLLPSVSVTPEHPIKVMEGRWCGHAGRICRPPKCSAHDKYQYVRRIPFKDRLKAVTESKNGNVKAVAKKFGIHSSALYYWRRGEKIFDAKRRPLFLDSEIKWKSAVKLRPKVDWLLIPKLSFKRNSSRRSIDLIRYVDRIITTGRGRIPVKMNDGKFWYDRRDKLPRFIPITKDLMNVLGWYLAEGFGTSGGLRFSFSRTERKFAEEVLNQLKSIFQKSGTIIELPKEIRLNYYSPLLEKIFKRLLGNGAHNKKIPDFIQFVEKNLQFTFLEAYWHGDGSFRSKKKNKRITTVSENIIWNLLSICNGNGLIPSTNSHLAKTGFKTPEPTVSRELCFNSGGFGKSFNKNYGIDDKFFYVPISKISKKFFNGKVYNFEIESNNTYCVPFIVHNCAKYSSVLAKKKTEFKSKEGCVDFAERVMREVLKRGKITFHPEYRIVSGRTKVIEK